MKYDQRIEDLIEKSMEVGGKYVERNQLIHRPVLTLLQMPQLWALVREFFRLLHGELPPL